MRAGDHRTRNLSAFLSPGPDETFAFETWLPRLFAGLISVAAWTQVARGLIDLGSAAGLGDRVRRAALTCAGHGPKLAKKILAELSDRIGKEFGALAGAASAGTAATSAQRGAVEAVVGLGYSRGEAEGALAALGAAAADGEPAELIRLLLRQLAAH